MKLSTADITDLRLRELYDAEEVRAEVYAAASGEKCNRVGFLRQVRMIAGVAHYRCCACKEWKRMHEFGHLKNADSKCGIRSECKMCDSDRRTRYAKVKKARQQQRILQEVSGSGV